MTLFRHAKRLIGTDLEPVVAALGYKPTNRGRYGRAVESLLGLRDTDNRRVPDWHGEIEVKWVALRRGSRGWVVKDKVFVTGDNESEPGLRRDPVEKIENALWVFGDSSSKRVLSHKHTKLSKIDVTMLRTSVFLDGTEAERTTGWRYLFRNTKGNAPGTYSYYLNPRFFTDQPELAAHIAQIS